MFLSESEHQIITDIVFQFTKYGPQANRNPYYAVICSSLFVKTFLENIAGKMPCTEFDIALLKLQCSVL